MRERALHVEPENLTILSEAEAKAILSRHGIPTTSFHDAATQDEAVVRAENIGYPVAIKVLSPKILHKSDIGGVALNLRDETEVRNAYQEIMAKARLIDPDAKVIIQEMIDPGFEALVGVTTDPHFGHVLAVGTGGILTELHTDVAFGLVPVNREHAWRMVRSLRSYPLLSGYRNQPVKDVLSLVNILFTVSSLVAQIPQIWELDLNPVIVQARGAVAADARIVLRGRLHLI